MRLKKIELLLPVRADEENRFFDELISFLSDIPNSSTRKRTVTFSPKVPHRSWPITTIGCSNNDEGQLRFLQNGKVEIELFDAPVRRSFGSMKLRPKTGGIKHAIEVSQLRDLFQDKLVGLDHIGLNIPSTLVSKSEYQLFATSLGNTCTFHHYPTGEDWDFILPSSRAEWKNGLSDFRPGREPKWEFVYDVYTQIPVIQLCIETKLTQKALCQLLPEPYGITYKGLPFRTVFIRTPWSSFGIRCDMSPYSRNRGNPWSTGRWLATKGKRIGPSR